MYIKAAVERNYEFSSNVVNMQLLLSFVPSSASMSFCGTPTTGTAMLVPGIFTTGFPPSPVPVFEQNVGCGINS